MIKSPSLSSARVGPSALSRSKVAKLSMPGFTLVELLVVIGIIALLISILLPALNTARRSALNIKCMANLHNLGNALMTYASYSRGQLPQSVVKPTGGNTGGLYLWDIEVPTRDMLVKAGASRASFYCPVSPQPMNYDWTWTYRNAGPFTDAGINSYLATASAADKQNMVGIIGYVCLIFRPSGGYPGINYNSSPPSQKETDQVWATDDKKMRRTWKYQKSIVPDNRGCQASGPSGLIYQKSNSAAETEIFADVIGSSKEGNAENFNNIPGGISVPVLQGTTHFARNQKIPEGANILFLDGHVAFRKFSRSSLFNPTNTGTGARAADYFDQDIVWFRASNLQQGAQAGGSFVSWYF